MPDHSHPAQAPSSAPVIAVKSDAPGQQDYKASAVVDGQELSIIVSENVMGIKGKESVSLLIGKANAANPLQYSAVVAPSVPDNVEAAMTRILTPHKDVMAQPDLYAQEAKQYPIARAEHMRASSSAIDRIEQFTNRDYEKFFEQQGENLNQMGSKLSKQKADVEFTRVAPEIVHMAQDAMFGHGSPGKITPDEFRQIRDAFQKVDAAPEHATNAVIPQPPRSSTPHK